MTIQVGDKIPDITLTTMTAEGPAPVTSADLFGGKKVVLFAVAGAFTPTCSAKHLMRGAVTSEPWLIFPWLEEVIASF